MAALDNGLAEVDASLDAGADIPAIEADVQVDAGGDQGAPEVDATQTDADAQSDLNEDGTPQTAEQKAAAADAKADAGLPKSIVEGIKQLKEKGASAEVIKNYRQLAFAHLALSKEVPGGLKTVREMKSFVAELSGSPTGTLQEAQEKWHSQQGLIQNINETDAAVAAGERSVVDQVLADFKESGNTENFYKLGSHFWMPCGKPMQPSLPMQSNLQCGRNWLRPVCRNL